MSDRPTLPAASQTLVRPAVKSTPVWALALLAGSLWVAQPVLAQTAPAAEAPAEAASAAASEPPATSMLDERLFYQLLVGEMALNSGDAGGAYELMLDAARRTRDEGLFRRAVDIALQARAGEQALSATRAWRVAVPESLDALRLQLQVLLLLNKPDALSEPLTALLAQSPAADRANLIAALPRFLQRASNPRLVASLMEDAVKPYLDDPATGVPGRVAVGRAWLEARDPDRALTLAGEAQTLDPTAPGPALLAMELMRERPQAEAIVLQHLAQPKAEPALRLAYVRVLTSTQRYADAVTQLEAVTRAAPDLAPPFLSLGALQLELRHPVEGEAALLRYVELAQKQTAAAQTVPAAVAAAASGMRNPVTSDTAEAAADDDDDSVAAKPEQGLLQAWLMLAQSAEQRGDYPAAERWLAKVDDPQLALDVQTRRASILARQGKLAQARELIRRVPERKPEDARAKLLAEAGMLRDTKHWREAYDVLATATKRFGDDADLLYEQAMMAEKSERPDDMEALLRKVIALKPDNAHAHNALGYALADRRQRLPEARQLIQRALELSPGDPFITDSLGWVEFRMGNREEAANLLRRAYAARPDTEIAAHLGEVLWANGQRDEARKVWREGKVRDAGNDVLRETLARLRVDL